MQRRCPNCKSVNVRRSSRGSQDAAQPFYRSPYRCRDCHTKFWAFSRKLSRRIALTVALVVVSLLVITLIVMLPEIGGLTPDSAAEVEGPQPNSAPDR